MLLQSRICYLCSQKDDQMSGPNLKKKKFIIYIMQRNKVMFTLRLYAGTNKRGINNLYYECQEIAS